MKTLIVVDMQNDFLPGGALEVPGSGHIVSVINKLQPRFDLVVATQDWHPANHMSFASNHPGKKPLEKVEVDGLEQILWPDHCVQNSKGSEFTPELEAARFEAIFRKGTDPRIDSYSTFYDNAHRKSTGLTGYLREKGAAELYFSGLAADFCVFYSVRDAIKEGFKCTVITDATCPLDEKLYEGAKQWMLENKVQFISSAQIL